MTDTTRVTIDLTEVEIDWMTDAAQFSRNWFLAAVARKITAALPMAEPERIGSVVVAEATGTMFVRIRRNGDATHNWIDWEGIRHTWDYIEDPRPATEEELTGE